MPNAREQLGQRLLVLRKKAGIDQATMAERLGVSQAQVSRIETAQRTAHRATVEAWVDALEFNDPNEAATLLELVEQAGTEVTPWRKLQADDWDSHQRRYEDLERAATLVRIYQPSVVPGLLQTAGYAEWLLREGVKVPEDQLARAVNARVRRGRLVLEQHELRLEAVIAEHVLRQSFANRKERLSQMTHLQQAAYLPSVDLGILPTRTAMPQGWGHSFVLLEMPAADESVIVIELEHDEVRVTDPARVTRYREQFEFYQQHAVRDPDEVVQLLASVQASQ